MALDATVLSTGNYCLQAFSKNVFARQESEDEINKTCEKLNCTTLTHSQVLVLNLTPADCDSEFSKRFNGEILIKNLVTVLLPFPSRHGRGVHAADFDWNLEGGISARGNF